MTIERPATAAADPRDELGRTEADDEAAVRRRAGRVATLAFVASIGGGIVAAVAYWIGHTKTMLGAGLAVSMLGLGIGLVAWASSLGVAERAVQEREPLCVTEADRAGLDDELNMTTTVFGRRPALLGLFGGSLGALIVGFVGPIGSLGPRPRGELRRTAWRQGSRLVTASGQPIPRDTERLDQLISVFPEGAIGQDDSQVVLLRMQPDALTERTIRGGAVDGWVAYSKICTHAGCSVGLFGIDSRPPQVVRQLVCPCHQSVFDPVDGARPVGGPATRSLPQLRLGVDGEGHLIAMGDFDRPVGPITWSDG